MAGYFDFFNRYVTGAVQIFFLLYFLAKILKKKRWFPSCFLFAVCGEIVADFVPANTIIGFVVLVLFLTGYGVWACHADIASSLLYAALMLEIMLLCYGVVKSVMRLLEPLLPAVFHTVAGGVALMLASEAVSLASTGFCYYMVYRYFPRNDFYSGNSFSPGNAFPPGNAFSPWNAFSPGEAPYSSYATAERLQMLLVFVPILMIFIMSEYINVIEFEFQYEVLVDEEMSGYLFSHWQLLVMYLLGLASLFCILFSYKKLQQNFRLSTEISLLEQQEHSLNQYVEEAKTRYDRTKSFRHDIRNHIAVVKKLLQSGKLEEAVSYMEDLDDMAEKMSFPCSTNHPVVDILVGNKLGIAQSMGIDVDCSLLLPYPCSLKDIDICIVLSNALDNAIQAVKSLDVGAKKYIYVSGRIQGDFLMMEIENSFHGNGSFRKGTGLSNVERVAEKYGGAMSIETQEKKFILHVLLIIPQHPESSTQQMD